MRDWESNRTSRQLEVIALCDANPILLAERELAAFARAVWLRTGTVGHCGLARRAGVAELAGQAGSF